jgi:uncharacterized protein DUF3455
VSRYSFFGHSLLGCVCCVLGCGGSEPAGRASTPAPPASASPTVPEAPAEIAVPAGNVPALAVSARGFQIYECAADPSGARAWKLHAPRAELYDLAGARVGIHYGGVDRQLPPGVYWESVKDGSWVHGGSPVTAPHPGSIPLVLLKALDTHGEGVFSRVTYIQRLDTTGGVAPPGSCAAGAPPVEVAYAARYYFYVAKTP